MKAIAVAPIAAAAVAMTACGGSSSKPGYCADRTKLEQSVKDLGNVKVLEGGGVQKLRGQLKAIETNARTVVSSAKSDFPSETGAIQSSVSTFQAEVSKLSSSASASQVAVVAGSGKAVATSVQDFVKATDAKC